LIDGSIFQRQTNEESEEVRDFLKELERDALQYDQE